VPVPLSLPIPSEVNLAESRVVANGLEHHVLTWTPRDAPARDETVVLCHGFLDLAWSWAPVARRLVRARYRVVAFDWRGHGESDWIGPGGYYHFPDYVLDLAELLPKLSREPPHLVGHSMGGTACATFAGTKPDAVRTLALLEGIGPDTHDPAITPDRFGAWLRTVERVRARAPRVMASKDEALARMRVQNPELGGELGALLVDKGTKPSEDGAGGRFSVRPAPPDHGADAVSPRDLPGIPPAHRGPDARGAGDARLPSRRRVRTGGAPPRAHARRGPGRRAHDAQERPGRGRRRPRRTLLRGDRGIVND
jgi:pimeloyl-ACP methyl ester carboxylesterase